MKKTRYFVILLAVLLCLSGCYPLRPMYEQEDADQITQKGTELMQGWLNKNMPGAELRECTADRLRVVHRCEVALLVACRREVNARLELGVWIGL